MGLNVALVDHPRGELALDDDVRLPKAALRVPALVLDVPGDVAAPAGVLAALEPLLPVRPKKKTKPAFGGALFFVAGQEVFIV
mgnify:CR=1 FL=1